MPGLEEWVFPELEEESKKKVHGVKQHRDLLELLYAACDAHRTRVALRMSGARKDRFTYGELQAPLGAGGSLLDAPAARRGDRVSSRARIDRSGRSPSSASWAPAPSRCRWTPSSRRRSSRTSPTAREPGWRSSPSRWPSGCPSCGQGLGPPAGPSTSLLGRGALGRRRPHAHPRPPPEDVASLIYTSGTTGKPKGVMLTHRNFASLVAKLAGIFELGPGDGLLSVLPLHHTFEFAAACSSRFRAGPR